MPRSTSVLALLVACAALPAAVASQTVAIPDVTIVDVREGITRPAMTVVISGDRIAAVGPSGSVAVPAQARVVDGTGRFLIPAGSQQPKQPDLVIENARVIIGDGAVLDRGSVVIAGGRIIAVTEDPVDAPGAERIDASGGTVLPGLIDAHVHLLIPDLFSVPGSDEELAAFVREGLPGRLRAYLDAGITTVVSTGDFWPVIRQVREDIEAGRLVGPRVLTSGPVLTAAGGHPDAGPVCGPWDGRDASAWCREHMAVAVTSEVEAREAVGRLAREGVDFIKLVYDSISPPGVDQLEEDLARAIVSSAHAHGLRAYAHISEVGNAVTAIEAGLDGLVHVPFVASRPEQVDALMEGIRAGGITVVTTLAGAADVRDQFAQRGQTELVAMFDRQVAEIQGMIGGLGKVGDDILVLGTDAPQIAPGEGLFREMRLVAGAGMGPMQIIQAATRNAADHIGRTQDLGTIEAGKVADLILVGGDPLKDLSVLQDVQLVVKGGEVVARPAKVRR
jgi:imidazolonepropionase-like amidohydrolase